MSIDKFLNDNKDYKSITFITNHFNGDSNFNKLFYTMAQMNIIKSIYGFLDTSNTLKNIKQVTNDDIIADYEIIKDDNNSIIEYKKNNELVTYDIERTIDWKKQIFNNNIFYNLDKGLVKLHTKKSIHNILYINGEFNFENNKSYFKEYLEIYDNLIIIVEPDMTGYENNIYLTDEEKNEDIFIPELIEIQSVFSHNNFSTFKVNPLSYYNKFMFKFTLDKLEQQLNNCNLLNSNKI